jgi:dihydroflavonol-4-reductase
LPKLLSLPKFGTEKNSSKGRRRPSTLYDGFPSSQHMEKPPRRVLVLGSTGHIGHAVVRHALLNGREVTAVTRRADPEELRGLGVKVVRIDGELRSLAELAAGHDLMVDAAAPYPLNLGHLGGPQWRYEIEAAIKHVEAVVAAARRHGLRLVYVSSFMTVPRPGPRPDADTALWRRSMAPYFEAKTAMEQIVIEAARTGLPVVIVNPAMSLGPWEFRDVERSFVPQVLAQRLPMVIDRTTCVIDVRDVADAIDRALSREFYGHPIPLAGTNIPFPDLVTLTAHLAGLPVTRPLSLDGNLVSAGVFWTHAAFTAFGLASPPDLGLILMIADALPMDRSPEQTALGVKIRSLEDTLRDAIAFHRSRGPDFGRSFF